MCALVTWAACILVGLCQLADYGGRPGARGTAPKRWPISSETEELAPLARLLVFCHPRCPCTRATLLELRRVLAQDHARADCQVFFYRPSDESPDWADGTLRQLAASIPGVTVYDDPDGARAETFGARTSGHTLLYGVDGRLLLDGGLTVARGHEGESPGSKALLRLLRKSGREASRLPVYGCPIRDAEEDCACTQ